MADKEKKRRRLRKATRRKGTEEPAAVADTARIAYERAELETSDPYDDGATITLTAERHEDHQKRQGSESALAPATHPEAALGRQWHRVLSELVRERHQRNEIEGALAARAEYQDELSEERERLLSTLSEERRKRAEAEGALAALSEYQDVLIDERQRLLSELAQQRRKRAEAEGLLAARAESDRALGYQHVGVVSGGYEKQPASVEANYALIQERERFLDELAQERERRTRAEATLLRHEESESALAQEREQLISELVRERHRRVDAETARPDPVAAAWQKTQDAEALPAWLSPKDAFAEEPDGIASRLKARRAKREQGELEAGVSDDGQDDSEGRSEVGSFGETGRNAAGVFSDPKPRQAQRSEAGGRAAHKKAGLLRSSLRRPPNPQQVRLS